MGKKCFDKHDKSSWTFLCFIYSATLIHPWLLLFNLSDDYMGDGNDDKSVSNWYEINPRGLK